MVGCVYINSTYLYTQWTCSLGNLPSLSLLFKGQLIHCVIVNWCLLFSVAQDNIYYYWPGFYLVLCLNSLLQVFRPRTPPEAIDLVSRLLEYTPSNRITPMEACAHSMFNELRLPNSRMPNGRDFPPLYNFTPQGTALSVLY